MTDIADDTGGVIFDGPFDPDAQATVSDFTDYTEYLPCDLIRSLTLIRKLDERYLDEAQKVHELTKIHGQLPNLPPESRPNPRELRQQISLHLDRALNAREASYAEACRLYDVIDRHYDRICSIKKKLESLPKPTPEEPSASATQSPTNKRSRAGKKGETVTPRITLRLDGQGRGSLSRSRGRRSVLNGLNPDSPIASTEQSDSEVAPKAPARKDKEAEPPAVKKEKQPPKRGGRSGTSGGRGGATLSTSAALAQLKPPPEDAKKGSEDLPWLRLTDWEMARLRKKMKKNANWQPSEIMINRELAQAGRGWEGYRAAKARAEETGEELIDCDDIMNNYVPGMLIRKSEAAAMGATLEETKTSNRGMMLNEAKRLKRENMAREQAALAAASAAEKAGKGEGDKGVNDDVKGGEKKNTRKRKAEEAAEDAIPAKKGSLDRTDATVAERATGAAAAAGRRRLRTTSPTRAESTTTQPSGPSTTTRSSTRRRSAAASAEPSVGPTSREHLRRKSTTPAATSTDAAGGTRRRKRPAPGPVSANKDGGAAVSYGRRKSKPTKKRSSAGKEIKVEGDYRIDEDGVLEEIDPNEPRYCLCGDVSFGTMICCENSEVSDCALGLVAGWIV